MNWASNILITAGLEHGGKVGGSWTHLLVHPTGTPSWFSVEQSKQPMGSQLIWSLEAEIVEDIEKQTVRSLHWDVKVPGTWRGDLGSCSPWPGARVSSCCRSFGGEPDHHLYLRSSLPYQSKEGNLTPGDTWMIEVAGGSKDEVGDTQR